MPVGINDCYIYLLFVRLVSLSGSSWRDRLKSKVYESSPNDLNFAYVLYGVLCPAFWTDARVSFGFEGMVSELLVQLRGDIAPVNGFGSTRIESLLGAIGFFRAYPKHPRKFSIFSSMNGSRVRCHGTRLSMYRLRSWRYSRRAPRIPLRRLSTRSLKK